jgi:hypothetical protein
MGVMKSFNHSSSLLEKVWLETALASVQGDATTEDILFTKHV